MSLEVRPVRDRRDSKAFLRLPWRIYADDPRWVPPLLFERRAFIDRRSHPFYKHGDAALFVAVRDGELVGRIMASDDPRYNQEHGENLGCFGMFESIDDANVVEALLQAAEGWLTARGRDRIRGPIDYSTNYACGLLVDGFDTPPRVLMNHNPPYYEKLLLDCGLEKAKDIYAWWFDGTHSELNPWLARTARVAERGQVVVRPFRPEDRENDIARCQEIYNEAWRRNWSFVSMTDSEFKHLARDLIEWAIPEMLLMAEVEGKTVGFSMTLPDFNEAIRPLDGRLFPFGLPIGYWRFRRNRKKIRTARMVTLGVLEGYRRRGVAEVLIQRTLDFGVKHCGYTGAELGWTLEDNALINRTILAVGGQQYKTYRIFERPIR